MLPAELTILPTNWGHYLAVAGSLQLPGQRIFVLGTQEPWTALHMSWPKSMNTHSYDGQVANVAIT